MVGTLIIINLKAMFSGMLRRSRGKKKKPASMALLIVLFIYVAAVVGFSVGAMFYQLGETLIDVGFGWFYFALAGLLVFSLCFVGSIFMVQSHIFTARDNELLLSMPIRPSEILAGRIAALLVFEYIFEAIVLLPVVAVLVISGNIVYIPSLGLLFLVIGSMLLPLMSLALGCFFGWLLALITSRMRNKNILTFIISILFLGAYFYFYSKLTVYVNLLIQNGVEIAAAVRRALPPAYHFGAAVMDGSAASFLFFAVCALVPFALMCTLLSKSFIKVTTAGRGARKAVYREKALSVSGAGAALLKRELRRFFSNPMIILNSALGALAAIVLAAVMLVKPDMVLGFIEPFTEVLPSASPGILACIVLTALCAVCYVSAPTVSLEGKHLWIIKSLPVPAKTVLLSKAGVHIVTCGLPVLLAGIVCILRLPVTDPLEIALAVATPAAATVMLSLFGVVLNLAFPRFDWLNEIQPVKQGLSSMLAMLGAMALVMVLALLYIFLLGPMLTLELYLLLCTALFAVLAAVLYLYLITLGVKRFTKLDA